jgi:hypothetical protein
MAHISTNEKTVQETSGVLDKLRTLYKYEEYFPNDG